MNEDQNPPQWRAYSERDSNHITLNWWGPKRGIEGDAEKDADRYNKENPNYIAKVIDNKHPMWESPFDEN